MYDDIIRLEGTQRGTTSVILAGIHGNETCGPDAFARLLPGLTIERGTVLFVYGNPTALARTARYVDTNLNRLFLNDDRLSPAQRNTYEYDRAALLKEYLGQADALLDLHASTIEDSPPFAVCEVNAADIVSLLPVDRVVSGFDTVEPGGTDGYMNSLGKTGICVECGYTKDPTAADVAVESILCFLSARGHLTHDTAPRPQTYVRMFEKYYAKTSHFTLTRNFANFEILEENETIGTDGEEVLRAPKRCIILFAHHGTCVGDEVFLLGEQRESLA